MGNIKETVRLLIDETTQKILQLATEQGYYPNQIARELGLSNSLVVTKLKELERQGIVWGRFESKKGKAVKRYYLIENEFVLRIDLSKGKMSLTEKEHARIKEIVNKQPDLFQNYNNYLLWANGKMQAKDIANYFSVTLDEAEDILEVISENLGDAFLAAYEEKIEKWSEGVETTFYELVKDLLIIPTQRIELSASDLSPHLLTEIAKGETYLSALKKHYPDVNVEGEVDEMDKRKMVVIEEQYVPVLNFMEIRKLTQEKLRNDKSGLFNVGRKTGESMARFVGKASKGLFEGLFKGADFVKSGKKEKVVIPECYKLIGQSGNGKTCYFISGLIEGVLQGMGQDVFIYEETCGGEGGGNCEFIISPKAQVEESISSRRVKKLLLGD